MRFRLLQIKRNILTQLGSDTFLQQLENIVQFHNFNKKLIKGMLQTNISRVQNMQQKVILWQVGNKNRIKEKH